MAQVDFNDALPAIWLVFGGSFLNHSNAPPAVPDEQEQSSVDSNHNNASLKATGRREQLSTVDVNQNGIPCSVSDEREQLLVNLLHSYLIAELSSSNAEQVYGSALVKLAAVEKLLEVWSEDLDFIYHIRNSKNDKRELLVKRMVQRFLQRIKTFENCTIISNGLIIAQHTHDIIKKIDGHHENVNVAILKKRNGHIDWVQVNPGCAYHQKCSSLSGDKNNAFLEITEINPNNITEDWLCLLVGLKTVKPKNDSYYKDVSLYECLLAHLNGKTVFQLHSDEGFVASSPISPVHTWQVVDQSFRYLLQHFLGDSYHVIYQKLRTGFKLFLMAKTLAAYQDNQTQECHFLLQEMCRDVAQQALDQGNDEQKAITLQLIDTVKAALEQRCSRQELKLRRGCKLGKAHVSSLSFVAPRLTKYTPSSKGVKMPSLKVDPVFVKPSLQDDIIDYLQQFKANFIDQLVNSKNLSDTALLGYGIETFFTDYLAKTNILQTSKRSSFSRNDTLLAGMLKGLGECYSSCQVQLVNQFLSNLTYQPQFYAKNVIIQFFVYAAIAALNFRDQRIGPLLAMYNLSIATSDSLSLIKIMPQLVINDAAWLRIVFALQAFFVQEEDADTLFSHDKFENSDFAFRITNDAEQTDVDVKFAYQLLQRDANAFSRFVSTYNDLDDEKLNRKWLMLAYSDDYLPSLYGVLSKVAYFAKASLTGLPSGKNNPTVMSWSLKTKTCWSGPKWVIDRKQYYRSRVIFQINFSNVSVNPVSNQLASYLLKSNSKDPYQRLIIRKSDVKKDHNHLSENEIVASQDKKPDTMDRIRYMQLGFLQSEPMLKLERLYIALKEQQLDFSREQESVLIKQTLFEIGACMAIGNGFCSLLEWTVDENPFLIHKLGLLCIEKARAMQYRLTQHHAIDSILEVLLALLTVYPSVHKDEFIEGIADIYHLLKEVLAQPAGSLSEHTLLHLNAYLIISVQGKPQLLETETLTVLKALLAIQNYKAKGIVLDNNMLLSVHKASFTLRDRIEDNLKEDETLLNDLMSSVIPQWNQNCSWRKSHDGLLFTCNDYVVKPLLGGIYFQNQPVVGLPDTITQHRVFKEYWGQVSFAVIPGSRKIDIHNVPCFLSVDSMPQMRFTLIQDALLVEEFIDDDYQRYIPAQKLLGDYDYPLLLSQSPHKRETWRHWLDSNQEVLFIKDQKRQIIYQWDLEDNVLFSLQHQGCVVPWDQLQGSAFRAWLQRIESPDWIEIIAQQTSDESIQIESLHFPRLGLHFDLTEGKFWCTQVHGYVLAEQQYVNTLHGFQNYFVLEKKELNSAYQVTKVIIPHRKVTPDECFVAKTVKADFSAAQSPTYFVYDYDQKTGLLKAHHTRAQLYLALLYYCSASLDDHDVSNCNAFHLARENLEVCWKDQPFDEVELTIIDQFLSPAAMRDFHSNRIALYLKVVFLLISSLRLAFLYTDEAAVRNKERSNKLLRSCGKNIPFLLSSYLQNKSTIFAQVRLNYEEEEDVIKQCISVLKASDKSEELEKSKLTALITALEAYCQLNFEQQSQVVLSTVEQKSYKDHYRQLFSKKALKDTSFLDIFETNLTAFSFVYDLEEENFLSGIDGILLHRFRLSNFITLYKLAKSSTVSLAKYQYLLQHMVYRTKVNYEIFVQELVMMLARALLLVAESPRSFPHAPYWFGLSKNSVDLTKRTVTQYAVFAAFPDFIWRSQHDYDTRAEEEEARREAEMEYQRESKLIWGCLARYDLDSNEVPCCLPENPYDFTLEYESHIGFENKCKQDTVKQLYLEAAYNDSMYQFFKSVLQQCDLQKYHSAMGWSITPLVKKQITVTIPTERFSSPIPVPVSLEKWAVHQEPLINFDEFFKKSSQPVGDTDFLFESQLTNPDNVYQGHFYEELKDSWLAYHKESERSYSWRNAQSMSELECMLQKKYDQIRQQAEQIWEDISSQLKQLPNSESDKYFALRWHSGQVSHYHKGDILRLLVEPHKLANYNPNCVEKQDSIIQSLLQYVNCEINSAKIVRVLAFVEEYKEAESEAEQFSMLHGLVGSLQESLDPASYRYPHWFLFQLENEIIVRENQRELIEAMLNQTEKAMYQLNMGEGKSSVILPLLSNNLANGQQILRINVLSALLITMKNFLRQRFSGLIRKRVYTLPFHRDTNISPEYLKLIFEALQSCQRNQHILLVTPEHRLCLQLKVRELMLENQQQMEATSIFNWQSYRLRVPRKVDAYEGLTETEVEKLLSRQDECLRTCLCNEKYIDACNRILKVPPRGQDSKKFARFKETINDPTFREWSCLKAAHRELLYNSTLAHKDSSEKLALLNEVSALSAIDLLDESDEILRHGTELNYTVGDKHVFAGGELRWQIPQFFIQAIFCDAELKNIIGEGKTDGFTVLNEGYSSQGGVPFIQLLDESYFEDFIKPVLVNKFFAENLPTLRKYQVNEDTPLVQDEVSSVKDFVAGQLSLSTEKKVLSFLADKERLKDKLLIAKGWLSHGILFHVFNAKYRVQYGLNLHVQGHKTKPIAIPFMGKDTPSPRSEFSHPDVMLGFTVISYLYQGLSQQQLKETLTRLKDKFSHQVADTRLKNWAEASKKWIESQGDSFPPLILKSLKHIDLADEQCLEKVHQYLSGNHLVILFYLNQFILLQEAMQYLHKISANAHSLVGYDAALGFSGTDDRKLTMPFQVKSLRSETQEGTNGKLLSVLTQERNSRYYSLEVEDTNNLLKQLCRYVVDQPHCHALIDAGALVTGLSNYEAASFLLTNLPSDFQGVLHFSDEGNILTVLTRDNKTVALADCYLDKEYLFAYLDDIHTRGTDIKLPLNCHAILTISMGMEKDKLMQAAMRLRQLAQKQSVSLWGTQAVTLAIARDNSVATDKINSFEVIKWVTKNTIDHINTDLFPVAVRKINFQFLKKAEAWLKEAPTTLNSLVQYCQEKEMFSLEEFYGLTPQCQNLADCLYFLVAGRIRAFWQEVEQELRNKRLTKTPFYEKVFNQANKNKFRDMIDTISKELVPYLQMGLVRSSLDNDEEKEVEVEIIQEQEVLIKVDHREAYLEELWDVSLILEEDFITVAEEESIIVPISTIGDYIQMPANLKNIIWHPDIYMTANFINTVTSKRKETFDNYLRPVDVVLIHRPCEGETTIILLSGLEAAQIKAHCYHELDDRNLLLHLNDINGLTQLPTGEIISKQEEKLLTIIKLFSGECHYSLVSEVKRLAKRVGRLYPDYFICSKPPIDDDCSRKLYGILIEKGYLDFSGVMTKKLLRVLYEVEFGDPPTLQLMPKYQQYRQHILDKLYKIYTKLIFNPLSSLKDNHTALWQWVGTRGRLKEFVGSSLESIINSECQLKYQP